MTAAGFAALLLTPLIAGTVLAAVFQKWQWVFVGVLAVTAVALLEGWPAAWLYFFGIPALGIVTGETVLFHRKVHVASRPEQERIP